MIRTALAPAKVNLFLHVGPLEADGRHGLCSLMVFADIGDRVTLSDADALGLVITGPFADALSAGEDNLVFRAARALLARTLGPQAPFRLELSKQLPVASGLGGGSSDAGAALRLIREVAQPRIDDETLEAIAGELGSDGPACLWAKAVWAEGRGERLSPAPVLPELHAVLVNPRSPSSTAAVYQAFDEDGARPAVDRPTAPEAFESAEELAGWLSGLRNDLEAPAIRLNPATGDVLETLRDEPESLLARVSGSGATCFALCAGDIEAEGLAERLERMRPDWWVRRCRLGGGWEA
jgi:4-diphosphocytidyl-2-C-methyl-D-erythritol kinase